MLQTIKQEEKIYTKKGTLLSLKQVFVLILMHIFL